MPSADFASRPLTIITGPMVELARSIGGRIVATRHRCGCYVTFRVVGPATPNSADSTTIIEPADLTAWLDYVGGSTSLAGAAMTLAARDEMRKVGALI